MPFPRGRVRLLLSSRPVVFLTHRVTLVNLRHKRVPDRRLDSVVLRDRHLPLAHRLLSLLPSSLSSSSPLNPDLDAIVSSHLSFLRFYPSLFQPHPHISPLAFSLTPNAAVLRFRELSLLRSVSGDTVSRLARILLLSRYRSLPLQNLQLLSWDFGIPHGGTFPLLRDHPDAFQPFRPHGDPRVWIRLLDHDPTLAVSAFEKQCHDGGGSSAFSVSFTRGFGLKKKWADWLKEWQALPYVSPYDEHAAAAMDPRTDAAEKRAVGVFHELLHLTVAKKTERSNLSDLRRPFALPQKFTKVLERHPGIFYLSRKMGRDTVVLREAYAGGTDLVERNPIVEIRKEYTALMRESLREARMDHRRSEDGCSDDDSSHDPSTDRRENNPNSPDDAITQSSMVLS